MEKLQENHIIFSVFQEKMNKKYNIKSKNSKPQKNRKKHHIKNKQEHK